MSRRSLAVNGGLSVALAASGVAGYLCIGSPVAAQAGTSRTATVTRGTVTATVSASGNAASTSTVGLSFGSAGTLTELDVKPGQTVRKGAVLAKIDPAGAQQSLRSAQAQLASAQAQLTAAGTGQTAAAASKDAIAVQQAQQTVSNAGSSVTQATAQQALDAKQQDQIVAAARLAAATSAAPSAAAAPSTRASGQLVPSDQRPGAAPTAGVSPGTGGAGTCGAGAGGAGAGGGTGSTGTAAAGTGARSGGSSGGATSGGGASSLDVVTAAEQTRDQTALRDAQSVTNAQQQLASAKLQLAAQQATATADAAGPAASGVATAQASVDSATSAVQTAQQTVDETVLHTPSAGTVVSVAGAVGEQVSSSTGGSAAGSGSGGSGSGGSGTTGSGGAGGGAASNSTGSASSAGTSGFLVLTDLTSMQVTTNVAEADAASLQDGQSASITFSASGATATGRVTAVAVNGTTSNNVVNYPVTVTLSSVPKGVRPGATASVVITTSTATDVLELPTAAITSLGSRHTVTLVKGTTRQVTPIEVGVAGGTTTEVTGGLSESDTVELPTTTPSTTTGGLPGFGGAGLGGLGGGGTSVGGAGGGGAGRRGGGG